MVFNFGQFMHLQKHPFRTSQFSRQPWLSRRSSLAGVQVPDENLTPQQRQHREEQLATLRKMQQMLFPERPPPYRSASAPVASPGPPVSPAGMSLPAASPSTPMATASPSPGGGIKKEASLMPVPSPQQIQYLAAFEGHELTIQRQPNTGLTDPHLLSPYVEFWTSIRFCQMIWVSYAVNLVFFEKRHNLKWPGQTL